MVSSAQLLPPSICTALSSVSVGEGWWSTQAWGGQRLTSGVFISHCPPRSFERGSLIGQGHVIWSGWLAHRTSGIHLPPPPQCWTYRHTPSHLTF